MGKVEDAWQTMVANYPAKTGRSLDAWVTLVREQDLTAHGTIVAWLKTEHGMGHGFANGVAAIALAADEARRTTPPSWTPSTQARRRRCGPSAMPW